MICQQQSNKLMSNSDLKRLQAEVGVRLGKLTGLGVILIWITVGQGPTALAAGTGGGCLYIFSLFHFCSFSPSLSLGDGPI